MRIREATVEDLDAIWNVAREAFRRLKTMGYDGPRHKGDLLHFLEDTDTFRTYVAEEDGKIVGFVMLRVKDINRRFRFDRLEDPPIKDRENCAYIMYIAVHPEYQGRGIGKRLFEKALEEAKKLGKRCLFGEFTTASPAVIRLALKYRGKPIVADVWYKFDLTRET